ncbi:unnamed protein product, partial [Ectocarpus sp. 12 AP-2014]
DRSSVRWPRGTNKPGVVVEDGAAAAEVALSFFGSVLFFSKFGRGSTLPVRCWSYSVSKTKITATKIILSNAGGLLRGR